MVENQEFAMEVWGDRQEIVSLGKRLKVMLPGGQTLSDEQAMALAQYSRLADANPFRGEIYAANIKGQVRFIDGYKLLVRWAKRKESYTEKFTEWDEGRKVKEGLKAEDIAYTCFILRDSNKSFMIELIRAGTPLAEAYKFLATAASGVVTKQDDMTNREGKSVQPPKGWTWHDVAKKRALKNALNISHGAPSPKEIAQETWMSGDTETAEVDWAEIPPDEKDAEVRARYAKLSALNRTNQNAYKEKVAALTPEENEQRKKDNIELMRGKPETGIGEDAPIETTAVVVPEDEDPFPAGPPADRRPINDLIAQVQKLGGTVNVDDPESRVVDEFQVAKLAMDTYKTEGTLAEVLKTLVPGITTIAEMSDVQLWNFYQYILRRNILMDTSLGIEERLNKIPEIVSAKENPPKTLKDAKPFLHQIFMMMTGNNAKMRRLINE